MANKNKNRGKSFEREVCKIFEGCYGGTWRRTPTSGAFYGGSNSHRLDNASMSQALIDVGDIIPPEEYEGLVIECKLRKTFAFNLLLSTSTELESWIEQASIDYEKFEHAKVFMVIFKVVRKGLFIVTRKSQICDESVTGLDYYYNNICYRLTPFDKEWLLKHKTVIDKLCKS